MMKCPFFNEETKSRHTIHRERAYIPGAFLLKEYCENKPPRAACPFFLQGCPGEGGATTTPIDKKEANNR